MERWRFLWEEFGPPVDMLLIGGTPSMFALDELKRSYFYGNFMATVLLAQVFIEQGEVDPNRWTAWRHLLGGIPW